MGIFLGLLGGVLLTAIHKFIKYVLNLRQEVELAKQGQTVEERTGHFVQVDCVDCGKLNRIPADKIRHRPICGGCKKKLLPKRKIVLYQVRNLAFDKVLSLELDAVLKDYDRFWATLDGHYKKKLHEEKPVDPKDLPN